MFLTSTFLLLKPPVASSLIFTSIVAFLLAGDVLFKALLYIGVDPQSEHETAPKFLKVFIIHGRKFGGHLMDLVRHLLGIQHVLLDCIGRLGRTLCGLEDELEIDTDLESQTDVNTPPSYDRIGAKW
ncbi:uncharacterized protein LACBIDRAFT_327540 [Laccaria bicolor S238N-H82]|uniref:Predicted protein n=1 Tax=Laccaria bicolor (strain S238N-H82 / ATCC MYA-4686) TaxID=486041 RepID=B0DC24_LACBS|nr:uncharacterized protein LACBIDRAFT_327540 [Laccaria bicolor S238N-H82]EDR07660.1 predicted protein [Laccaria bicolor S238N-H82]|eukprot:XP_001881449.1 predicted protein [Laccaria bicolor S238N-H82]